MEGQNHYPATTIAYSKLLEGVLRPKNIDEVSRYVSWAKEKGKSIYPVSGGCNWGYGSKSPVKDGAYLLDLSNLNKIHNVDERAHTVTLQAGVTQQQLFDYFQKNDLSFIVPTNGAGPSSSLIGNLCERGYGITPIEDRFQSLLSCKVVLPDGTLWQPLLADMGLENLDKLFKWGIGPYVEGLFTQSNLGIIVEATLSIRPRPEHIEFFTFQLEEDSLESIIDGISNIKSELGSLLGGINLMNGRRMLSMTDTRHNLGWSESSPMSSSFLNSSLDSYGLCPWNGLGTMYGPKPLVKAAKKIIKKNIKKDCRKLIFLTQEKTQFLRKTFSWLPGKSAKNIKRSLERLEEGQEILTGTPRETALRLAYWKGAKPAENQPLDPARDKCGLIWYSPLVPLQGDTVRKYTEMVERVCLKNSIEPLITLTTFDHRLVDSTVPILFDQNSEEEISQAHQCYNDLLEEGRKIGVYPYRFPIFHAEKLFNAYSDGPFCSFIKNLKESVDPEHTLSPGRYCPSSTKRSS